MRIQDIISSLGNRWIIYLIATWAAILIFAILIIYYLGQNQLQQYQKVELSQAIEMLKEKKKLLDEGKKQVNLEDAKLSMILSDILTASSKSNVSLGQTEIAEVISRENYSAQPIIITAKGDYNQIGTFVNLLEKNLRFQILDVQLSTKESKAEGIVCRIKVEFVII